MKISDGPPHSRRKRTGSQDRAVVGETRSPSKTPPPVSNEARFDEELERKVAERTKELTAANAALRAEISERKLAEGAVRQAEDRIRLIIDTIPTMAWSLDRDGSVDFVNQRWMEYTGLSLEEALTDASGIVYPDDLPQALEKWASNMAAGNLHEAEMRLRRADGEYRWFLVRVSPLRDAQGDIVEWYGISIDIEDRKQAEMQAQTLIDVIPHKIWSGPPDGTNDYVNARWRSETGLRLEDTRGDGWQTMIHPEDRDRVLKAWNYSVQSGTPYEQEERHRGVDGTYRWYLNRGVPLRDHEGRIVRWYGTHTDIEDRKRAEAAAQAFPAELLRAQDAERRRIARELHDSTVQELAVVAMNLGRLEQWIEGRDSWAENLLADSLAILSQGHRSLRTLAHLLHPPMLEELGLIGALKDYVEGFAGRSGIQVELESPEEFERCSTEIETALFRIVQESLSNVHRHSESKVALIKLTRKDDLIELTIGDRGRGLPGGLLAGTAERARVGVGIAGMRQRVAQLQGRLEIISDHGGTTVRAILPVHQTVALR